MKELPSSAVHFVRTESTAIAKGKTVELNQGETVLLRKGNVAVKVRNNKFHSLMATSYIMVVFDNGHTKADDDDYEMHQVEPTFVGQFIESGGISLAQVADVQSGTKLLTLVLAEGVEAVKVPK